MTYDDIEERVERAEANWQEVSSGAPPAECEWGFFSYGDAPPAIGGGAGMFTWFPDRESMLAFIENTLPYFPPGQADLDAGEVADHTAEIVHQMRTGALSDKDALLRLNKVLETCSQLQWIGTVTDLLSGDHAYAAEVRASFRDDADEAAGSHSIAEDEKENFFDFLDTWGI